MKNAICFAFDRVTMPAECENRIYASIQQSKQPTKHKPNYLRIAAVTACLIAVILLLPNSTVAEALEKIFSPGLQKEISQNNEETTVIYRSPDGKFTDTSIYHENGAVSGHGHNNLLVAPEWYLEQDDRVYFTANGEWIDVTDLIDLDTPFTYIYTDQSGIIHYICIGGAYDPDPEVSNVGYAEWYYDPDSVNAIGVKGDWIGGYADNHWNKETNNDWPWLQKAKEIMGIPWL